MHFHSGDPWNCPRAADIRERWRDFERLTARESVTVETTDALRVVAKRRFVFALRAKPVRTPFVAAFAVAAILWDPIAAEAKPGTLDPSFGTGGVAYTGVPAGVAYALALQPDGKTVIAVSPGPGGTPPAAL